MVTGTVDLRRRGLRLEYLTAAWNVIEGIVAVWAGIAAGSIALVGFGLAVLIGANFTDADLGGSDLTGADLTDVLWSGTTCPDGTNSDDAARSCENHLQHASS